MKSAAKISIPLRCACPDAQRVVAGMAEVHKTASLIWFTSHKPSVQDWFVVSLCCQLCQIGSSQVSSSSSPDCKAMPGEHLRAATDFVFSLCLKERVESVVALLYLYPQSLTAYEERLPQMHKTFQDLLRPNPRWLKRWMSPLTGSRFSEIAFALKPYTIVVDGEGHKPHSCDWQEQKQGHLPSCHPQLVALGLAIEHIIATVVSAEIRSPGTYGSINFEEEYKHALIQSCLPFEFFKMVSTQILLTTKGAIAAAASVFGLPLDATFQDICPFISDDVRREYKSRDLREWIWHLCMPHCNYLIVPLFDNKEETKNQIAMLTSLMMERVESAWTVIDADKSLDDQEKKTKRSSAYEDEKAWLDLQIAQALHLKKPDQKTEEPAAVAAASDHGPDFCLTVMVYETHNIPSGSGRPLTSENRVLCIKQGSKRIIHLPSGPTQPHLPSRRKRPQDIDCPFCSLTFSSHVEYAQHYWQCDQVVCGACGLKCKTCQVRTTKITSKYGRDYSVSPHATLAPIFHGPRKLALSGRAKIKGHAHRQESIGTKLPLSSCVCMAGEQQQPPLPEDKKKIRHLSAHVSFMHAFVPSDFNDFMALDKNEPRIKKVQRNGVWYLIHWSAEDALLLLDILSFLDEIRLKVLGRHEGYFAPKMEPDQKFVLCVSVRHVMGKTEPDGLDHLMNRFGPTFLSGPLVKYRHHIKTEMKGDVDVLQHMDVCMNLAGLLLSSAPIVPLHMQGNEVIGWQQQLLHLIEAGGVKEGIQRCGELFGPDDTSCSNMVATVLHNEFWFACQESKLPECQIAISMARERITELYGEGALNCCPITSESPRYQVFAEAASKRDSGGRGKQKKGKKGKKKKDNKEQPPPPPPPQKQKEGAIINIGAAYYLNLFKPDKSVPFDVSTKVEGKGASNASGYTALRTRELFVKDFITLIELFEATSEWGLEMEGEDAPEVLRWLRKQSHGTKWVLPFAFSSVWHDRFLSGHDSPERRKHTALISEQSHLLVPLIVAFLNAVAHRVQTLKSVYCQRESDADALLNGRLRIVDRDFGGDAAAAACALVFSDEPIVGGKRPAECAQRGSRAKKKSKTVPPPPVPPFLSGIPSPQPVPPAFPELPLTTSHTPSIVIPPLEALEESEELSDANMSSPPLFSLESCLQ